MHLLVCCLNKLQNARCDDKDVKFHTDGPLTLDTTVNISRQGNLSTWIYAHLVQKIVHSAVCLTTVS